LKAEYLPGFVKDLKALRGSSSYVRIHRLAFDEIERFESIEQIPTLKKLRGFRNAYRIRTGDYRIGFLFDGQTVIFARVLHRKDIYRFFP
jgi:mRNA interferase RelE/StbE